MHVAVVLQYLYFAGKVLFDEFVRCPLDIFLFPNEINFRNSERPKTPISTKLVVNFGGYRKTPDPVLQKVWDDKIL